MFYPEYIDMETEVLGAKMEMEMTKFLDEELPSHIIAAISTMCKEFSFIKSNSNVTSSKMLFAKCFSLKAMTISWFP